MDTLQLLTLFVFLPQTAVQMDFSEAVLSQEKGLHAFSQQTAVTRITSTMVPTIIVSMTPPTVLMDSSATVQQQERMPDAFKTLPTVTSLVDSLETALQQKRMPNVFPTQKTVSELTSATV